MLYDSGIIYFTRTTSLLLASEALQQLGELQKICDQKEGAALADNNLKIRCDDVGPVPRHRAHAIVVDAQQEPRAVSIVALAYAYKLPSIERMERVRHADKTRRCTGKACILS